MYTCSSEVNFMTKFSFEYTVRGSDIDVNYKIRPDAICGYFQESFARYCTQKNVAAFDVIKQDVLWVIADMRVQFSPLMAFWGEKVRAEVWCSEIKQLRLYVDFRIYAGERVIAQGDSCFFIIDKTTRKPRKSIDIAKDFSVDEDKVFGEHKRVIFERLDNPIFEKTHIVGISDLDFNYHVNNLSYVNVAFSCLKPEYLKLNYLRYYEVAFVKESFLNDEWNCELYQEEDYFCHKFVRKSDGELICAIKTFWEEKIQDTRDVCSADFNIKNLERKQLCTV